MPAKIPSNRFPTNVAVRVRLWCRAAGMSAYGAPDAWKLPNLTDLLSYFILIAACRLPACVQIIAVILGLGPVLVHAMPAAPAGVVETGAPSFVVLGPEALGLSTAPIDLHLLPDGRILVVSQHELTFGDGLRWEAFRQADDQSPIFAQVAVDHDGKIYAGIEGGIGRIDLVPGARWHFTPVTKLPGDSNVQSATPVGVSTFSDSWLWYGSTDAIISWRPGQTTSIIGKVGAIDRIFKLGSDVFLSKQSSGELFRLRSDGTAQPVVTANILVSEGVTCAIPFGPGQLLVGTGSAGVKLFDGKTFRPFDPVGLLSDGHRITDLCATGEGLFAAAVDTVGIVFFDREGRTVQTLERSLDHRLGRVQRLRFASNGVLWALLTEGLARVEFPSPISHFEPLLVSGLRYPAPLRHDGRLWILADGRAMRGIYDAGGHLDRFEDDTPQGHFLFTLDEVGGQLFSSNDQGIYVYETTGWRMIIPGITNARVRETRSSPARLFYSARGEYGMIRKTGQNYTATRIPMANLSDNYNCQVDSAGIAWLELGVRRIGRLDPRGENPTLQILGGDHGLADGWIELFLLDGTARFHAGSHLCRFDDLGGKFVEDHELLAHYPQLALAGGRPTMDSFHRLWYTADGAVQVIDRSEAGGDRPVKIIPVGFAPTGYTLEDDGVVWITARQRIVRMDLRLHQLPASPLHALITSVEFPASKRQLFALGAELEPISYDDNSLVIHFAAPANPFASPITFEVLLEGVGSQWVSTGAIGSAAFNGLKEGPYVIRVRPVAGATTRGEEARLAFTVLPPWYRTPLAWTLYFATSVGLIALVIWFPSFLHRRENRRLELLVAKRTEELNATNSQLGRQIEETTTKSAALSISEERFRVLNAELEGRVQERTAKLAEASGLLDAMLENSPDHIYFKDRESRFVRFSRACLHQFGLTEAGLLRGKTDGDFFAAAHAQAAYQDEQKIIHTGEAIVNKLEQETHADGHVTWALTTKMPWRDGTGAIVGTFGISKLVTAWKEAEAQLAETHKQLMVTSRQAGMAEVATGVLHNVGNVLNSVNVSATLVAEKVRHTKAVNIVKIAAMLDEHRSDLAGFLTTDSRGLLIPDYLTALAASITTEQTTMMEEIDHLRKNIEHIKEIVAMQQSHASNSGFIETVPLAELVEDALRMNASSLVRHQVELVRDYRIRPEISTDRHKFIQILVNLVRNAKEACGLTGRKDKRIIVLIEGDEQTVRIVVSDNGVGIPAENLARIFNHGFTTRKTGHGFGLHNSALAARQLGGSLCVQSDGQGTGATFVLELPLKPDAAADKKSAPSTQAELSAGPA